MTQIYRVSTFGIIISFLVFSVVYALSSAKEKDKPREQIDFKQKSSLRENSEKTSHSSVNLTMEGDRQPNIIMILADDLGYGDIGSYGNTKVKTPNLDRLAEEGTRFVDFHSNGPMCSPTRAALLTGRYQQRGGVDSVGDILDKDEITIAERLQDDAGYATGMFGKWHVSGHNRQPQFYRKRLPNQFGFDEFRGFMSGFIDYNNHLTDRGRLDWWHNDKLVEEDGYASHLLIDDSIEFIRKNKEGPFFLYLAFPEPHFPWMTPDDGPYFQPGEKYPDAGNPKHSRLGPHDGRTKLQSVVHRMINEMDEGVGRLIKVLEDLKISENTFIFFTSDNGGYIHYNGLNRGNISDNGPLRGQKVDLYEGGHRVPAIAWWPGQVPAGKVSDEATMTHDIHPTFLELAGLNSPNPEDSNALDGTSLLPILLKDKSLPERNLFWAFGDNRAVRYGDWKLVWTGEDPELYNLANDIEEANDQASKHPDKVIKLLKLLSDWEEDVGIPVVN